MTTSATAPRPPDHRGGARPGHSVRIGGRISFLLRPRTAAAYGATAAATAAVLALSLVLGDYDIALSAVPGALAGQGERLEVFFVQQVRLPRALTAIAAGAALGAAGAVFQSLSRNLLGSPDIIGFTSGAATGAVAAILLLGGTTATASLGAVLGGVLTGALVYLLALKRGVQGYRLVLVGIGVSAMLVSVRDYLITRAELTDALSAQIWIIGSLNGRGWAEAAAVGAGAGLLVPVLAALSPRLRLMEMGQDTARALGVPVQGTQLLALAAASALTGVAIAVCGPIGFVALAAPQLARRLVRAQGTTVVGGALMGALLLAAADLVAQRALAPFQVPVGVVTAVIGGSYLIWLLYREWRGGRV